MVRVRLPAARMVQLVAKLWVAQVDSRTTSVCLTAAGQVRPVSQPFTTQLGEFDAPPAHVHCRSIAVPFLVGAPNRVLSAAEREIRERGRPLEVRRRRLPPKPVRKVRRVKRRRR